MKRTINFSNPDFVIVCFAVFRSNRKNPAYSIFYEYLIATAKYKTQGTYPTPRQEDFVYYNISFYVFILHKFIYLSIYIHL